MKFQALFSLKNIARYFKLSYFVVVISTLRILLIVLLTRHWNIQKILFISFVSFAYKTKNVENKTHLISRTFENSSHGMYLNAMKILK